MTRVISAFVLAIIGLIALVCSIVLDAGIEAIVISALVFVVFTFAFFVWRHKDKGSK